MYKFDMKGGGVSIKRSIKQTFFLFAFKKVPFTLHNDCASITFIGLLKVIT